MEGISIALIAFACLVAASFSMMFAYPKLSNRHRDDETNTVVRLIANIFVVMTSLVFGLLINSAKNTFAEIDSNVHAYGASLIILDRSLRTYGPEAQDARQRLENYAAKAIEHPAWRDGAQRDRNGATGQALDELGNALAIIEPADRYHESMLTDARQQYHSILQQRWRIIEHSEGAMPAPLIGMLIAWMTLIFGSFGYRAPANPMVMTMFLVSALLISASLYLVLNMTAPFDGPIQISDAPLHRALAEIRM